MIANAVVGVGDGSPSETGSDPLVWLRKPSVSRTFRLYTYAPSLSEIRPRIDSTQTHNNKQPVTLIAFVAH